MDDSYTANKMSYKITTLGGKKLEVNDVIGIGGSAQVYSAIDLKTGKQYAIKVVVPTNGFPTFYDCKKEGKHFKKCKSLPYVGTYSELFIVDHKLFVVMPEYKPIQPNSQPEKIAVWFYQLLYGINEIHKKGIIHGDIKVGNIMLDENDDIRIIDFGISVSIGSKERDICPHVLKSKKRIRDTIDVFDNAIKKTKPNELIIVEDYPEARPYDDLIAATYTILSIFNSGKIIRTRVDSNSNTIESLKEILTELNSINLEEKIKEILEKNCGENKELFNFFHEFITEILLPSENEPIIKDILDKMESKYQHIICQVKEDK